MNSCDVCPFLNDNPLVIYKTKYWTINLSPDQSYLGRCYVSLNRHNGDLDSVTSEEWKEFPKIIKGLENSLRKAFKATMFNWTCLMNNAYREKAPNPHVHWHFRPRYNHSVTLYGLTFEDPEFGYHYAREKERSFELDSEKLIKIASRIKDNLIID